MRTLLCVCLFIPLFCMAQIRDTGVFIDYKAGYYQNYILKGIEEYENPPVQKHSRKYFAADMAKVKLNNDLKKYHTIWRQPPVSQGNTGTCWSFGATSMFESEIWRMTGKSVKLSEMYFVYWEYVERATDFVSTRGKTYFAEGSESNALIRLMEKYGCVPWQAYSGMLPGQTVHHHEEMLKEMNLYLESVRLKNVWNEEIVNQNIQAILDRYMGRPPMKFTQDGNEYSPLSFLSDYCKIKPRDYFSFMSTLSLPYDQKGELVEADNWWHSSDYYNVCLDDFLTIIKSAISYNYGICICGDVSEPGFDRYSQCGIIPSFDIPTGYIDESSRELRLLSQSTTDDHCMHLIGFLKDGDQTWFVLKDSGAGAFDGTWKGYRFVREDYVKLKMMNILLHKEAARVVLDRIIK